MAKSVQVLLRKEVKKLGKADQLVEVAPGYARNYLIPQGIASYVTPGLLKQVEHRQRKEQERIQQIRQQAENHKTALETVGRFTIRKQVGEKEAIFGTVTPQDVAEAIQETTGQEVDRRNITLPDISKTGFYPVEIKLHPEVTATVEIQVAPL